jgi:hypothetical protein
LKTQNLILELIQNWIFKLVLLIGFLILGNYCAIGQQKMTHHVALEWDENQKNLLSDAVDLPTIKGVKGFYISIPVSSGTITDVNLSNIESRSFTDFEGINAESIKGEYNVEYNLTAVRGEYSVNVMITPYKIGNANIIEQLLSCDIVIHQAKVEKSGFRGPPSAIQSVLTSGDWYKIGIAKAGLVRLDKAFFENTLKIDLSKVNPKEIKIFGNRGGRMPESNKTPRDSDLTQLSIQVIGEEDGKFDNNDVVLFYGEGADRLLVNSTKQYYIDKNIYDNNQYYFLTISSGQGKRIKKESITETPTKVLDDYEVIERVENDLTNLLGAFNGAEGAGQEWYGEYFKIDRQLDLTKSFNLAQAVTQKPIEVAFSFAGRSSNITNVSLKIGNKSFAKNISASFLKDTESNYASKAQIRDNFIHDGLSNIVQINYPSISVESEGWLDYLQLTYSKKYVTTGTPFIVRSREGLSESVLGYKLSGSVSPQIWDVTNPYEVYDMSVNNSVLTFKPGGIIHEFYNHNGINDAVSPISGTKIGNQNIHGITDADAFIIYHPLFGDEAERLAIHRSKHSKLKTYAIDIQAIYNEYSGGKIDPVAIRDMCKYQLEINPSFRFLTLMGDGSYDYKGIVKDIPAQNFIPVYETPESLHPINAFPSDDFYGLLDDTEGENLEGGLDIGIGRLPAKTDAEAKTLVDKIIHYETSPSTYGDWRLRSGYTSDDEDGDTHISDMDVIARADASRHPLYNQQKVYFDAYNQVSTSGESRYPDANKAINENIQKGQLALTYLGHGGPQGWAQERVLTIPDIGSWDNYNSMFIMVTATCSFAAYDDPSILTPGEQAILNPNGGAIALYSTTRSVYTNSNKDLTEAVNTNLYKKVNNEAPRLGQVFSDGKNKYTGIGFTINSRKFTLLGDAAMQIAMPKYDIVTTTINNRDANVSDTVSALEKISLEGIITDEQGKLVSDFNGTLSATVFDKISKLQTLGNDQGSSKFPYSVYKNVIFKGNATVENGKWKFSFWVPKSINYNIGLARISMYATDGKTVDAGGYYNKLNIGGPTQVVVNDTKGPEIDIYMDSEQFVAGGQTTKDPLLILNLKDDLGINVTGNAIGQDITAELDNNSKKVLVLNDFYEAKKDDFTSGTVRFRLKDLSLGLHTISAKAWDISGNSAAASTEFVVVEDLEDIIQNVLVFPNPFASDINFRIDIGDSPSALIIDVPMYSIDGKEVLNLKFNATTANGKIDDINVDESYNLKNKLASGIYYFKIIATNTDGSYRRESHFHKLIKI